MAIYNKTELQAANAAIYDSLIPDNNTNQVSPADHRNAAAQAEANKLDSEGPYTVGCNNFLLPVATYPVTATPAKFASFLSENPVTKPAPFLAANLANNSVDVTEPCILIGTVRWIGQWTASRNLTIAIFINGALSTSTPTAISVEGNGATDNQILSISGIQFIVTPTDISNGGGTAELELYVAGDGAFNVNNAAAILTFDYQPYSIRTT